MIELGDLLVDEDGRQRVVRRVAIDRRDESIHDVVADEVREIREAWRHAEKADPQGYPTTPVAERLRIAQRRISAIHENRDFRVCENCEKPVAMRKSQKYCSTRCGVAAHRRRTLWARPTSA